MEKAIHDEYTFEDILRYTDKRYIDLLEQDWLTQPFVKIEIFKGSECPIGTDSVFDSVRQISEN